MPFTCSICEHEFSSEWNYQQHQNRKEPCRPPIEKVQKLESELDSMKTEDVEQLEHIHDLEEELQGLTIEDQQHELQIKDYQSQIQHLNNVLAKEQSIREHNLELLKQVHDLEIELKEAKASITIYKCVIDHHNYN